MRRLFLLRDRSSQARVMHIDTFAYVPIYEKIFIRMDAQRNALEIKEKFAKKSIVSLFLSFSVVYAGINYMH